MSNVESSLPESMVVAAKNASGASAGERELAGGALDTKVRYRLIKDAAVMYLANKRSGTHRAKSRAEVSGSKQKPWRQKGTGRARSGTRKSPVWRGGGVVFAPRPRDYSFSINRKQKRLAVKSALLGKVRDGEVLVLEGLDASAGKTRVVAAALKACGISGRCLIGTAANDPSLFRAARNIPGVQVAPVGEWNALDVVNARTIVLLPDAFELLNRKAQPAGAEASVDAGTSEA